MAPWTTGYTIPRPRGIRPSDRDVPSPVDRSGSTARSIIIACSPCARHHRAACPAASSRVSRPLEPDRAPARTNRVYWLEVTEQGGQLTGCSSTAAAALRSVSVKVENGDAHLPDAAAATTSPGLEFRAKLEGGQAHRHDGRPRPHGQLGRRAPAEVAGPTPTPRTTTASRSTSSTASRSTPSTCSSRRLDPGTGRSRTAS